jgi:hypothetical protein
MMTNHKVQKGQIWQDKKTGGKLAVLSKHHDTYWNCVLLESKRSHRMNAYALNKYFILIQE